jgi:hypothetical protein
VTNEFREVAHQEVLFQPFQVLGNHLEPLDMDLWREGSNVAATWKYDTLLHERLAPHRVLFRDTMQREPALFVWIEQTRQLGQGHGRTVYGKLLELLRAKNVKLGLLTNGRQFRLCYAGLDYDSWVEWDVESIGLMHQGLLDFNVHATDQPMIFLNLGQEPVLPLALLEGMSDQHLKDLLKKLSIEKSSGPPASEGEEGEADEVLSSEESEQVVADGAEVEVVEPLEVEEAEDAEDEQEEATMLTEADLRQKRALAWAERAVEAAGLLKMKKPKANQTDAIYLYW